MQSLDAIDLAILRELQDNGRMTNVELARRIGISAPPCLRRVRSLEETGVLTGYRALIEPKALGYDVAYFAFVQLDNQSERELSAFEQQARNWPAVRECWTLSGDVDFVLKCIATDLADLQRFVETLTATPNVRKVRTSLALKRVKDEAAIPFEKPAA